MSGRNSREETSHCFFWEELLQFGEAVQIIRANQPVRRLEAPFSHQSSGPQPRSTRSGPDRWALRPVTCLPAAGHALQVSCALNLRRAAHLAELVAWATASASLLRPPPHPPRSPQQRYFDNLRDCRRYTWGGCGEAVLLSDQREEETLSHCYRVDWSLVYVFVSQID